MKKKLTILIILLFIIVGCGKDIKKTEEKMEREVKKEISNVENINDTKIKESLDYIDRYIDNTKKSSGNYSMVYKNIYYLNAICSKDSSLKDNKVCKVGSLSQEYINDHKKDKLKEIKSLINDISDSNEINNLLSAYHTKVSAKSDLEEIQNKVLTESKTEGFITKEKINKALGFILNNYAKPFDNSEVLYKMTYYTEYLNKVGTMKKQNDITELSALIRKYLNTGDEKVKQDIESKIVIVEKNKEKLIKELL